jgi:aryl-alcohol dehydrogenase-like predicted oxidoreductase
MNVTASGKFDPDDPDDDTRRLADRIGLGLAALGRPAYLNGGRDRDIGAARSTGEMRTRTAEVLDAAYAGGIRYVDTARSYGHAEEFLADWLASRPEVTDVEVASKWGYRYVGDWRMDAEVHEVKEHTLRALNAQLEETRALLGDRLDLYQVHSVTEDSPVLSDGELQRALADLRDRGVRVGFSTSGPRQPAVIRAALSLDVGGAPLFSSVQSTWNLLESSAGAALSEAHDAGVAVVIKEVFANGRLAPGSTDSAAGVRKAQNVAADLGIGLDQLAIAAALRQPWSPRVLSGAVTVSQVGSHLAGFDVVLPPDVTGELAAASEDPDEYWSARSRRTWA